MCGKEKARVGADNPSEDRKTVRTVQTTLDERERESGRVKDI